MTRLAVCAVLSLVAHVVFERGLELLPPMEDKPLPRIVEIRVLPAPEATPPEPPPEPVKPPEPVPPELKPVPQTAEKPRPNPVHVPQIAPVAKDLPAPEHPAVTTDTQDEPVFGVDMNSTSQAGAGPQVAVGNTLKPAPTAGSAAVAKPLSAPVAAYEATKMPLPQGRCFGKYTDEALAAGTEGTVVLDLTVGEDGRAREIVAVDKLPNGLTEAALAALRDCHFTPGEKDGHPVAVRIRGFKIRFVRPDSQP